MVGATSSIWRFFLSATPFCWGVIILSLFPHLGDRRWIRQRSTPFRHLIIGIEYGFFFYLVLKLLEAWEHFTLLLHWEDPYVAQIIIDEADIVSTFADRQRLSRHPYTWVDYVKDTIAYVSFLWEPESMLFSELTSFTHTVNLCKESWWILCSRRDDMCVCVCVRGRESRDTENTQANVYW